MRASGRFGRLALVAGVVGGALAAPAAAGAQATGEHITAFWAQAELAGPDGSADVVEVIDWDFAEEEGRHGIFREVPGLETTAAVEVTSPEAPTPVEVSEGESGANVRIGDADETVTGEQRYRIAYPLGGLVDGEVVQWTLLADGFDTPMDRLELHLVAPFGLERPECRVGGEGSPVACDVRQEEPGHLVATAQGIDAGLGVTLFATVGEELAEAPEPAPPPGDEGSGDGEGSTPTETAATTDEGGGTSMVVIIVGAVVMLGAAIALAVPLGRRR